MTFASELPKELAAKLAHLQSKTSSGPNRRAGMQEGYEACYEDTKKEVASIMEGQLGPNALEITRCYRESQAKEDRLVVTLKHILKEISKLDCGNRSCAACLDLCELAAIATLKETGHGDA